MTAIFTRFIALVITAASLVLTDPISISSFIFEPGSIGHEPTTTVTINLTVDPNPDNIWGCVQVTSKVEDWNPIHCGFIYPETKNIVDVWPNMPKGAYETQAFIQRADHTLDSVSEKDIQTFYSEVKEFEVK